MYKRVADSIRLTIKHETDSGDCKCKGELIQKILEHSEEKIKMEA